MQLGADYYLSMATSGVGSRVLEAFLSEKNSIPLKKKFAIIDALQGHYATVITQCFPPLLLPLKFGHSWHHRSLEVMLLNIVTRQLMSLKRFKKIPF